MLSELQLKILEELLKHGSTGLKARELSNILRYDKSYINHLLYNSDIKNYIEQDFDYRWYIPSYLIDLVKELLSIAESEGKDLEKPNPVVSSKIIESPNVDKSNNEDSNIVVFINQESPDNKQNDEDDDIFVGYDEDNDIDEIIDNRDDEGEEDDYEDDDFEVNEDKENEEDDNRGDYDEFEENEEGNDEDDDRGDYDEDDDYDYNDKDYDDKYDDDDIFKWRVREEIEYREILDIDDEYPQQKFDCFLIKYLSSDVIDIGRSRNTYDLFDIFRDLFLNDTLRKKTRRFENSSSLLFSASNGFKGYADIRNDEYVLAGLTAFADFWDEVANIGYSFNNGAKHLFDDLLVYEPEDTTYSKSVKKHRDDYYLAINAKPLIGAYLEQFDKLVSFEDIFAHICTFAEFQNVDKFLLRKALREDKNFVSPDGVIAFQLADRSIFSGSIFCAIKTVLEKEGKPLHISELVTKVLQLRPDTVRKNVNSRVYNEIQEGNLCSFENSFIGLEGVDYPSEYIECEANLDYKSNVEKFKRNLAEYKKYIVDNNHLPFSRAFDEQQRFLYNWFYRMSHNLDLPICLKTDLYLLQQEIKNNHTALSAEEYDFFNSCNDYRMLLLRYGRMIDASISEKYCQWFDNSLKAYKTRSENIKYYFEELLELLGDFGYSF